MYRLPSRSKATSEGDFSAADVAGPPSPAKLDRPLPASVSSAPVFFRMRRTREALPSEKTRFPSGSRTTFASESRARAREDVAAMLPSGENPLVPLPAIVVIFWAAAGTASKRARRAAVLFTGRLSQGRRKGAGARVAELVKERSSVPVGEQ